MGVIYKLRKEIINYIIKKKKENPSISCRKLVALIKQEFNKEVSKSSINSVIKEAGLSMPVGRRRILEQCSYELESAGIFFLKAADWLLGGSLSISEIVNKHLGFDDSQILNKIEYLIYNRLLSSSENRDIKNNALELDFNKELCLKITKSISELSKGIRILKLNLTDKSVIYLDGQLHTVWPSTKIPNSFSTTLYDIKRNIKKIFLENNPLVLFMSAGYDTPTEEFFNFISSLNMPEPISSITLINNDLTEIETISLQDSPREHFIIFGIWPWQFGQYHEIKSIDEFKPFYFFPANKDYYIAETIVELSQHNVNKRVILNGCILKKALKEKEVLSIYTNLNFNQLKPEEIAAIYLNKWPNLEEGFINFSRNIENFVHGSKDKTFFDVEKFGIDSSFGIKKLLDAYFMILDSFVRLNFLPDGYGKDNLSTIKDRFYGLKGIVTTKRNEVVIKFCPSSSYSNIKELQYACNRVNERNILIPPLQNRPASITAYEIGHDSALKKPAGSINDEKKLWLLV